uniref:Uncharacterized protein n=1 Tax=Lotharella oceanica TaxID=641309 RepID=A0A7S2TRJ6_9EUKA|mmetsp:Transcript_24027/g.44902  ORF Transcript_24027/g.44902 Transcript_24027/m.44902 type:complete len:168 (+) Transcript_24027:469-972(+)
MAVLGVLVILGGVFAAVFAEYSYDVYFSDDALVPFGSIAHFFLLALAAQMISLGVAAFADPLAVGVARMWFLWVTLAMVGPGAAAIAGRVDDVREFAVFDVSAGFVVWALLAYQTWTTQPEEKYGWIAQRPHARCCDTMQLRQLALRAGGGGTAGRQYRARRLDASA